jgi:phage minor structural protein
MVMIKIFNSTDRLFNTNGNIVINPFKCMEIKKKSLNGWYIDVEVPIKYKDHIFQDKLCVIKSKSKLNPQAFRIKNIEYTSTKIIFNAEHVMFDAIDYLLLDVRAMNLNGLGVLTYINERADNVSPFTISSDVITEETAYFIRKNLLEAWSIIEERWNGVFDADNWNISFKQSIGVDSGEVISYNKNLQHIKKFEDWSNVVTKILPVGKDGLLLPEKYLIADIEYDKPYTKTLPFETDLDEENQTEETLLDELREKAIEYLNINKYPQVSYEINSDINQLLGIGDTIEVKHPLVTLFTEVLEYEYNTISKKVKRIVFGNFTRDVKAKFDNIKSNIKIISEKISLQEQVINGQTNLINTLNKLGNVFIDDNEVLILDVLPKENAQYVMRLGLAGIGFSSNGYEGPFEYAWTLDGVFNANFIKTGTMAVERVTGLIEKLSSIDFGISTITSTVTDLNNRTNTLVENVTGLTNTMKETGGLNIIHDAPGYFKNDYWNGPLVTITNTEILDNTRSDIAFNLQNGTFEQTVNVQNGTYTLSGLYKKLLELANIKITVNDVDLNLNEMSWTQFIYTFQVTNRSITVKVTGDSANAGYVADLMLNSGDLPQVFSLNQNETYTDAVKIGKGLTIEATNTDTRLEAGADGIRMRTKTTGNVSTEFTTEGTTTNKLTAQSSLVAGLLTQRINGQVCMNNIGGVM